MGPSRRDRVKAYGMTGESPYGFSCLARGAPVRAWRRIGGTLFVAMVALLSPANPARAEAVIAVAGPATGFAAERTAAMTSAVASRVAEINASGGINGERVRLETVDDGCGAVSARIVAEQLVELKPLAVLGHPCSGASQAAAGIYGRAGILYLAIATRRERPADGRAGPTVFHLAGREDRQGAAAAAHLQASYAIDKIAIVHDRAKMNRTLAEAIARALGAAQPANSGPRSLRIEIDTKRKDYSATANALKPADAIVFAGFPMEAGFLLQALRQSGSQAEFLVAETARTAEFTDTFGDAAIGVKALAATGGVYPGLSDRDWAEAAVTMVAEAARRTGRLAPVTLASVLQAQRFTLPFGCVAFSVSGEAELCAGGGSDEGGPPGADLGLVTADYGILTWNGTDWVAQPKGRASAGGR